MAVQWHARHPVSWPGQAPCRPLRATHPRASQADLIRRHDADGDGKLTVEEVAAVIQECQAQQSLHKPLAWDGQVHAGLQHAKSEGRTGLMQSLCQSKVAKCKASDVIWSSLGMFLSVLALGCLNQHVRQLPWVGAWHQKGLNLLLGSFGTICVLLFARPEAEAIRAWNIVMGHVVSVAAVVGIMAAMGPGILSRALAMAVAVALMLLTDSVHPPGGALVLMAEDSVAIQSMSGWFLLYPSLTWTFAILLPLGAIVNYLKRTQQFDWPWSQQGMAALPGAAPVAAAAAGLLAVGRVAVAGSVRTAAGRGLYAAWLDRGELQEAKLA